MRVVPARPRPPILVVDTTAFFQDLRMTRDLADMLEAAAADLIRVVVPEVVILETCRHQAERANKASNEAVKKVTDGLRALNDLLVDGLPRFDAKGARDQLAAAPREYETWLRETLKDHQVEVAPIPPVSHADLVHRDLEKRKPFNSSGKGYRDALIWSTVIEIIGSLDTEDHLVFVTENTDDFADSTGLSADLLRDLPADPPKISLSATPSDAMSLVSVDIDAVTEELENPGGWVTEALVVDLVRSELEDEVQRLTGADVSVGLSTTPLEHPTWYNVDLDFSELSFSVNRVHGDHELSLELHVAADVVVDGYINKWDYYGSDDRDVEILDGDWNETMVWATVSRRATLVFEVAVDADFTTVTGVSLDDATGNR